MITKESRSVPNPAGRGPTAPAGRRRGRIAAAATAAAVLATLPAALASCGSTQEPATAASGSCPSPGVSGDTIKIGLIYPDTGGQIADSFRDVRSAVQARVDAQNAAGGVHGRTVQIVWRDDQSDPGLFRTAAQDLVDNQKVFGLIVESIAAGPTASWLEANGIPAAGVAIGAGQHRNLFSFGSLFTGQNVNVDTFGRYVRAGGGTKALVVVDPSQPAAAGLVGVFGPSLTSQGVQVAGQENYPAGATTPAHIVDALRHAGADTLIGVLKPADFADIYTAAKTAGVKLKVALSAAGYEQDLLDQRGAALAGMSVIVGYASFEQASPAMTAFHSAMATYSPELQDPNSEAALSAYVSTDEMLKGLDLAGACPTREGFITGLHKVTDYSAGGLIAPTDLSNPTAATTCFNFVKANATGTRFEPVTPPAGSSDGFWCGKPLS